MVRKERSIYHEESVKETLERVSGVESGSDRQVKPEDNFSAFWVPPRFDVEGVQETSGIGPDGLEYPDGVPLHADVALRPPPDVLQDIERMIRNEALKQRAREEGFDTPEEAMDLDMDDEMDAWPKSEYEENFYPASPSASLGGVREEGGKAAAEAPPPSPTSDSNLKDDGGPGAKPPKAD